MSSQDIQEGQQYFEDSNGVMMYDQMDERTRKQIDEQIIEHMGRQLEEQLNEHVQVQVPGSGTRSGPGPVAAENTIPGDSFYGGAEEDADNPFYTEYQNPGSGNIDMTIPIRNISAEEQKGNAVDPYNVNSNNVGEVKADNRPTSPVFPRQVMTALGPLPLPEEFRKNIPEKFVAKPIIEEREIYVSKKERKQREVEVPHVQYEHTFKNVRKQFRVSKLIPTVADVIKEVPKEILKPVIEEKIIEVPQGVKYVEVPVEVPCLYPPKIVPRVVTQYVERIVETVKPIVQEKIIEVPQTVIKQVPKIKTVEVPYYVPRYVEKIVEVPFRPKGDMPTLGSHMPFSISKTLPPLKPTHLIRNPSYANANGINMQQHRMPDSNQFSEMNKFIPNNAPGNVNIFSNTNAPGVIPSDNMGRPVPVSPNSEDLRMNMHRTPTNEMFNFNMTMPLNPRMNYNSNMAYGPNMMFNSNQVNGKETLLSQVENLQQRYKLPDGIHWGYPDGVSKPSMKNVSVPPIVVTCPPEIGKVTCSRKDIQPDILTKTGVHEFDGFKKKGSAQALFPPLAQHSRIPFLPPPAIPGTPDLKAMQQTK